MGHRALIYCRCSTARDQNPDVQRDILKRFAQAREWEVIHEIVDSGYSGTSDNRPGLKKLMQLVRSREIDIVVVVKLDRLFRSLKHLVNTLDEFKEVGVQFVSVMDQIDMTTSAGKLFVHLLASFSEFEAGLIRERTLLGLAHATNRGKRLGRPPIDEDLVRQIQNLRGKGLTHWQIKEALQVSKGTVYRALLATPKTSSVVLTSSTLKRSGQDE